MEWDLRNCEESWVEEESVESVEAGGEGVEFGGFWASVESWNVENEDREWNRNDI